MAETLVLAGGCFWGMQELLREQTGVIETEVGYTGGKNEAPTYEFHPGHAEAVRVIFDETKTSIEQLLEYFFRIHDPTTLNKQGNDTGESYRSTIFYKDERQKEVAKNVSKHAETFWKKPVTTTLEPLGIFYSAEDYHQDYLQKNPDGYTCHYERIIAN